MVSGGVFLNDNLQSSKNYFLTIINNTIQYSIRLMKKIPADTPQLKLQNDE